MTGKYQYNDRLTRGFAFFHFRVHTRHDVASKRDVLLTVEHEFVLSPIAVIVVSLFVGELVDSHTDGRESAAHSDFVGRDFSFAFVAERTITFARYGIRARFLGAVAFSVRFEQYVSDSAGDALQIRAKSYFSHNMLGLRLRTTA